MLRLRSGKMVYTIFEVSKDRIYDRVIGDAIGEEELTEKVRRFEEAYPDSIIEWR